MSSHVDAAQLWDAPISGIELFTAQLFQHRLGKHFHNAYAIGLNEGGQGRCLHQQATHYHAPGSFNCIDPYEVHTGEPASEDGWAFRTIYISLPAIKQALAQLGWSEQKLPHFPKIVVNDPSLRSHYRDLFQVLSKSPSQLTQQSLLLQFLSRLFSKHAQLLPRQRGAKPESKAVALIRDYLEAHCVENVSVDDLAKLTGLNPYYLIRCFCQQVGVPPHRYKQHWQLLAAKQALHSEKPLAGIAVEYGFYDQSHFSRAFKQTFALPPGAYRKVNFIQS
ncbi:MAG: AraC family transcriptional regulator [Phormidesmis sp.]